jgi:hypothetical protein
MKQTFDTNEILFGILKGSSAIASAISGGVYVDPRPLNSEKEDIVINTIALSQDSEPQIGTSNVNIHVPDKTVSIGGVQQKVTDNARLKVISGLVLDAIRSASVQGLKMLIETQSNPIPEAEINQHYINIRVSWNIH